MSANLVEKGGAVGGIFGEHGGPTHQWLAEAVAVVGHAHAALIQVGFLLQQSSLT